MLTFIIPLLLGSIIGFLIRGKPDDAFAMSGRRRAAWAIGIGFIGLLVGLPIGLATSQSTGPQTAGLIGGGLGLGVLHVLSLEYSTYQKWSDRHSFVWLIVGFTCAIAFSAYRLFDIKLSMPSQQSTETEMRSLSLSELQAKAESGDPAAQVELGGRYDSGRNEVAVDDAQAAKWYRLAAEQGSAEAQWLLGASYDSGDGVPEDDAEAVRWYRLAAEQGDARGQWSLGTMFLVGTGVPKDDAEAVNWFQKAADQGYVYGQLYLGNMFFSGTGVPRDYAEALRWYRLAAEQGLSDAQVNLGMMYANGEGVPKNNAEAYFWLNLAASQGDRYTTIRRDELERVMTREQIAEAQRRSAAWKPKKE
jgi:TPR repeat protein